MTNLFVLPVDVDFRFWEIKVHKCISKSLPLIFGGAYFRGKNKIKNYVGSYSEELIFK